MTSYCFCQDVSKSGDDIGMRTVGVNYTQTAKFGGELVRLGRDVSPLRSVSSGMSTRYGERLRRVFRPRRPAERWPWNEKATHQITLPTHSISVKKIDVHRVDKSLRDGLACIYRCHL